MKTQMPTSLLKIPKHFVSSILPVLQYEETVEVVK